MSTVFEQILSADVAQDVMIAHLKKWLPTYLAEVDEQRGFPRGFTSTPKSWQVVPSLDGDLSSQLPAMLIISPGTADRPDKLGDGKFLVTYTVGVISLVKGPDQLAANRIAKRYGSAISACVMQHKSLDTDHVEQITWEGDSYDDVPSSADRTMSSATVHFNVQFKGVLDDRGGPHEPIITPDPNKDPKEDPTKPYPPRGQIPDEQHIVVTLTRQH